MAANSDVSQYTQMVLSTSSFAFCSMGMMVFNKLAVHAFPLAATLVAVQMAFTVLVMCTFCWSSLHIGSWYDAARWCRVVPFFVGMLLTSMFALKDAPMSLVITFRALTPCFTLLMERLYPNPVQVGFRSAVSLATVVVGACMYASSLTTNDQSSLRAIGWVMLNTAFAMTERLLQRLMLSKDQAPADVSKTAASLLNNLGGMFPMIAVAYMCGETSQIQPLVATMTRYDMLAVFLSCVVGVGISFTAIWAQSLITATSMLVLTNANKFVVIILEVTVLQYAMPTSPLTACQIVGAMVVICASIAYAMERSEEEKRAKAKPTETAPLLDKKV